jgi:hypothetical protein
VKFAVSADVAEGQAGAAMTTRNIKALIQALPQYREVLGLLSVHINLSSDLTAVLNQRQLTEMGELEQSLIYGDNTSQDLIRFLQGGAAHHHVEGGALCGAATADRRVGGELGLTNEPGAVPVMILMVG